MKWRFIASGFACGIFFESVLNAPRPGFYLIPIMVLSIVYATMPFTFSLVNIGLAWLSGIALIFGWAFAVAGGHLFSFAYFLHVVLIVTIVCLVLYAADQKK